VKHQWTRTHPKNTVREH